MTQPGLIDDVLETGDGRRVGYLARGPEDGRPVLYLHGAPGSRLEQHLIPDEVLDRFHVRLVSVDRPGYGETDPLAGDRPTRAQDALAVCDALDIDRFAVVAVSSGGSNGLTLAALEPDRVERVVLSSGQMPYDDADAITGLSADQAALLPLYRGGRTSAFEAGMEAFRTALLADPLAAFEQPTTTLSAREKSWYSQSWVEDVFIADMQEAMRRSIDGLLDDGFCAVRPFEVDVSSVRCPVRAVHGSVDDWEPLANLHRILEAMPDSQVMVLEGLNHFGPQLYPDVVVSLAVGDR